jgi:hypothetical protein
MKLLDTWKDDTEMDITENKRNIAFDLVVSG